MYASEKKMRRANEKTEKRITDEEAKAYLDKANETFDSYGKYMIPVGKCAKCGGMLFIYAKSNFENMLNVYCSDCNIVEDARFPKAGDMFLFDDEELKIEKGKSDAFHVLAIQRKEGSLKDTNMSDTELEGILQTLAVSPAVNLTAERRGAMDL
jgi:ssDNA-binding Zn-finger/Zn-ribbon topoisomerase 1